jgi:protein-S-isoprenylcysteine O-methyltransferase Ste14
MKWFHFEIGWLNLWILALLIFSTPILLNFARGERGITGLKRATELPPMSKSERAAYMLVMSPQFLLPLYTVFVPFTSNTALLSAGLLLFSAGQTLRLKSIWDYTTAAPGELISHGVYRISRNPGYFGGTLVYLGLGIAGGSWLIVAIALYWFAGYQWVATVEEHFCQEKWPEAFAAYKQKTAKNFVFF